MFTHVDPLQFLHLSWIIFDLLEKQEKQLDVFSSEAKYHALTHATTEVIWLR